MYALYNNEAHEFLTCTFNDSSEAMAFLSKEQLQGMELVPLDGKRMEQLRREIQIAHGRQAGDANGKTQNT